MCLGIPGRVTQIQDPENDLVMGKVSFGGVEREVCLSYTPEVKIGDYVLVHVGFAINVIDEQAAQEILADLTRLAELGGLDGELPTSPQSAEEP